jgi:predicted molibdopterin-dependent oxidoreductase YjgC
MEKMRISRDSQALPAVQRGETLTIEVDGRPVEAFAGETVAVVLLAMGRRSFRHTDKGHAPRGLFCGMGVCFDCLVTVDGVPNVRACMTPVRAGMVVATGGGTDG